MRVTTRPSKIKPVTRKSSSLLLIGVGGKVRRTRLGGLGMFGTKHTGAYWRCYALLVFADKQREDKLASALGGGLRPQLFVGFGCAAL
jgi:hypothetical protein